MFWGREHKLSKKDNFKLKLRNDAKLATLISVKLLIWKCLSVCHKEIDICKRNILWMQPQLQTDPLLWKEWRLISLCLRRQLCFGKHLNFWNLVASHEHQNQSLSKRWMNDFGLASAKIPNNGVVANVMVFLQIDGKMVAKFLTFFFLNGN